MNEAGVGEIVYITRLTKTCHAMPAQWDGRLSTGQDIYIRYRSNQFGVGIGDSSDEAVDNTEYQYLDHSSGGDMSTDELHRFLPRNIRISEGCKIIDKYQDMSLDEWRRTVLGWSEDLIERYKGRGVFRA